MANASLARFSTTSGVALRHRNSQRTSTTTYNQYCRETSFLAHCLLAPVRGFQCRGALTSTRHRLQTSFLHIKSVPLPEAPNSGKLLPPLFPNLIEPLQSMQSEDTVAIRQHLQTTDSDNFDVDVEEYIIQEHNDEQISSDGTVAWSVTFTTYTILLTTCPTDLPVKPNQALPASQSAYHTHLATQESIFRPARHLRFITQNMLHKLHPVNWSAATKHDASVASRAHMHTLTSSNINSRFTQHMCVPLCWKRHALIPNHARAAPT